MADRAAILFRIIALMFLVFGLVDIFYGKEENKCEMTYMFEYPRYLKVPMENEIVTSFPRYSLYLYGEGEYFGRVQNLKLHGTPVLFIPGHGGSYKQVRSLASVLLRMSFRRTDGVHFNVFTANLNEELVAFYGGTLHDQLHFVQHCVNKILSLYDNAVHRPTSVILVAHSMGGVIATGLPTLSDFDVTKIQLIVTLATPHLAPVIDIDSHIHHYYERVDSYWRRHADDLRHITVLSISGDSRDFQVSPSLTRLRNTTIMTDFRLSVSTRAVPKVYLSTDHQCIVWCKQLVLVQARFLFDMIDARSKQISPDWGKRTLAVGFHFRRNSGVSDGGIQKEPSRVKLGHPYAWREIHSQCWSLHDEKPSDTGVYFAIPVLSGTTFELIARTNTDREQWIFACRADVLDGGKCVGTAADLSHLAAIMPHYRVLHLSLKQLLAGGQQYTHIVMPVARGRMSDLLEVNLLSSSEKSFEVSVPHVFSNLWTLGQGATYTVPASRGCRNRFYYELHLKDFHSIYQSFHLRLNKQSSSSKSGAMVVTRTEVPWDVGQASFGGEDITVKIRATVNHTSPSLKVHVYDSSRNSLTFQLRVAFLAFLGQVVRNFGASLPVYVLANALLVFCHQLQQLRHAKPCHDVYAVHELVAKPYKIQPFISITRFFFGYPLFVRLWQAVGLPVPDSLTAEESGVWFTFAPLLLFLYAFELFRFTLAVQRGIIAALQLLLPLTPFPPKFLSGDTSNAILARMAMHLLVLAMLLRQWSFYAFFYIFSVSFIRCSRLCGRIRPLTVAGKNDVNTVLMSSAGISSQSQSTADSSDSLYSANSTSDEDFDVYGGLKASDDENIVDSGKTQTSSSLTTSLSETSLDSTPVEHVAAGGDFVGAPGDLITQPSAQSACDDAAPPDSVSPVGDDDDQDDDDVERDIQYETANTADDEENSVESNDDNHPEDTDTLSKLSAANKTAENDSGATVCNQPDTTAPPNPFATPVKSLDPTSKSQDQFSVNFILLQLWLWLTLFSLPSVIAFEVNHRSSPFRPIDPWFVHATVASLLFSLPTPRGQWDGLARSKLRPITGFAVSVVVLMVVVSASSVYRAPAFMLAFLALHTFAQFV